MAGEQTARKTAPDTPVFRAAPHNIEAEQALLGAILVNRLEEVARLEEVGNPIERLVIDQNRPEQRLLGFDIVRRAAEQRCRVWRILARARISWGHGMDSISTQPA